jgi:hypothetical protein
MSFAVVAAAVQKYIWVFDLIVPSAFLAAYLFLKTEEIIFC